MIDPEYKTALVIDPADVRRGLAARVEQALAGGNGHAARRLVRLEMSVGEMDPFAWLQAQPDAARLFWSGRGDDEAVAAVGVADVCQSQNPADFNGLRQHLAPLLADADAAVRYYGGLRFDPSRPAPAPWRAFGTYRFVLPRFELRCHEGRATLVCNLVVEKDRARRAEVLDAVARLAFPPSGGFEDVPIPIARANRPDEEGWRRNIAWALDAFEHTRLDKVVFAREATFEFDEPLDALALLRRLKAGTPGCFHFYIQPEEGTAFVGATPERLFRRRGRRVETEAVAGTRPRGTSERDDARLLEELLGSDKDRREHEYVRVSIREELAPLAMRLSVDAHPSEMKLAVGRHLVSRVRATLRPEVTSLDVLQALHPTPAVGGYPTDAALEAIRQREAFDRGWYAGPVGWIGPDAAEFAVGIRSGLVESHRLSLYSGAGIVPGSTPEEEWEEIECKLGDFTKVLGLV